MCLVPAEAEASSAKSSEIAETTLEEQEFQKYASMEQAAFGELTKYMEELLDNPQVLKFTEVTSRYVQSIKNNGISDVKSHTKKKKLKMQTSLTSRLVVFSIPTANITEDLLEPHTIREQAYFEFKSKRLFIKDDVSQFHSVMQRQNLKTFTDLRKQKRIKVNEKELILKADRGLFAQMAIVAERREFDMITVLSHPLGSLPWALAATDGTIRKTNKSKLFELLNRNFPTAEVLPDNAAYVIDGMALVQQLVKVPNTFVFLADKLFSKKLIHESILFLIRTEVYQ
ncbi:unnamed protein product [Ceutorhynchus assimilis]|uniref:Uncharacterized protein n=1 Tax=Ceutorhynchus assimilis TaxID=467358 RepID=A0A9N9QQA3_9CUCU|nr:unnamed protein product [Ceutorhynchus assimilis]